MAFLIFVSGELKGQKFDVNRDEITMGRSSSNMIPINDPSVSGKHAKITKEENLYELTDLDSTNGTLLNGEKVHGIVRLKPSDTVKIGEIEFIFEAPELVSTEFPDRTTKTGIIVKPGAAVPDLPKDESSPFGLRRDSKILWILVMVAFIIVAVALFSWFLYRLFC